MKVTKETLEKIASLSKLSISPKETTKMLQYFNKTVQWLSMLNEVSTENIQKECPIDPQKNILREDIPSEPMMKKNVFQNTPYHDNDYFRVPIVKKK